MYTIDEKFVLIELEGEYIDDIFKTISILKKSSFYENTKNRRFEMIINRSQTYTNIVGELIHNINEISETGIRIVYSKFSDGDNKHYICVAVNYNDIIKLKKDIQDKYKDEMDEYMGILEIVEFDEYLLSKLLYKILHSNEFAHGILSDFPQTAVACRYEERTMK